MIVPMKKISLVLLDSRRGKSLTRLRAAGAVHLVSAGKSNSQLEKLQETHGLLGRALSALPTDKKETRKSGSVLSPEEAVRKAEAICALAEKLRQNRDEAEKLNREIERLRPWGEYDPGIIRELETRGLRVRLYEFKKEDLNSIPQNGLHFVVYEKKAAKGIAWIGKSDDDFPRDFEAAGIPEKGLVETRAALEAKKKDIEALKVRLESERDFEEALSAARKTINDRIDFEQAGADLVVEGKIAYLQGYIPEPKAAELKKTAAQEGWGLLIQDPGPDDVVPTLTENSRFIRIIQPVFEFLGVAPGYKEVDISTVFMLFFIFFFAMIIGDAAYGLIFLTFSLYLYFKQKKTLGRPSNMAQLLVLLTSATVVWGAVTGVWFGSVSLNRHPFFSWMIVPRLNAFDDANTNFIKQLTFIVGIFHLTIAHVWNFFRALRQKPVIKAVAQLGWLSLIWGLYFFVLYFVLDPKLYPVPPFAVPMVLGGVAAVFIFGKQEGNFFKGILTGLADFIPTTLSSVSAFADIISYIRLFAVGLATVEIAKSFNAMASGLVSSGPVGIAAVVLILLAGHGLNMAMSCLSVLVHGIRLNLLEFSGHLGLEWAGVAYKPFKEHSEA